MIRNHDDITRDNRRAMSELWPAAKGAAFRAGGSLSRAAVGGASLTFIAVWLFRWLSMGALENDHFAALARAHQILHGDWPVRDLADPGQPLTYLLSAGRECRSRVDPRGTCRASALRAAVMQRVRGDASGDSRRRGRSPRQWRARSRSVPTR